MSRMTERENRIAEGASVGERRQIASDFDRGFDHAEDDPNRCEVCERMLSRTDVALSEMCSDGPICTPCFDAEFDGDPTDGPEAKGDR